MTSEHLASLHAALLVLTSLAATATKAAEPNGWYVGASSDDTHVEVYRGAGWEVGGEQQGLSLHGGLRLHRNFAVELGAMRAANLEWTEYYVSAPGSPGFYNARTTFDASALNVSAVGIWPFGQIFEAHFQAGLALFDVSGVQMLEDWSGDSVLSRPVQDSGSGHLLGLGFGANVAPNWRVRIEYQYFAIDRDFLGVPDSDDPSIDSFSIGVDYRFGERPP